MTRLILSQRHDSVSARDAVPHGSYRRLCNSPLGRESATLMRMVKHISAFLKLRLS